MSHFENDKQLMLRSISPGCPQHEREGFFRHYFHFSLECRAQLKHPMEMLEPKQRFSFLIDLGSMLWSFEERVQTVAASCDHNTSYTARTTRSAIEFLEEDVIRHDKQLQFFWRIFMNGCAVQELDDRLTSLWDYVPEFDAPDFVEGPVPLMHNWWRDQQRELRGPFGELIPLRLDDVDHSSILPALAVTTKKLHLLFALRDPTEVKEVLINYFSYSSACRLHGQHPLSMFFEYDSAPMELFSNMVAAMETKFYYDHATSLEMKLMLSALQFFEEDVVPHNKKIQLMWDRFGKQRAKEMEQRLLGGIHTIENKIVDLRMVKESDSWWTTADRQWSQECFGPQVLGRGLSPFTLYSLEREKKRLICTTLKLSIFDHSTLGTDFLWSYFRFSKRIRSLSKNPRDFLTSSEHKELKTVVSTFAKKIDFSLLCFCYQHELKENLWRLRACRSAIQFLEEEIVDEEMKDNWNEFLCSEGVQKMNERLEEYKGKGSGRYLNKWGQEEPIDLRGVEANTWWPEDEIRRSEEAYGKRGW